MENSLVFLARKYKDIQKNHYKTEHCGVLSFQVGRLLFAEGYTPHQEIVYEEILTPGEPTVVIEQIPYYLEGKRNPWHAHFVCCTTTHAYDPLLGEPVPLSEYTERLFKKKIRMTISLSSEEFKKQIDNF